MSNSITYRFPIAKYPAVRLVVLLILGIIWSDFITLNAFWWTGLFFIIVLVWAGFEYLFRKTLQPHFTYFAICCYSCSIICFGALWNTMFRQTEVPPSAQLLSAYTWESVGLTGTIQNINQTSSGKYQLDIDVNRTTIDDSLLWQEPYKVRAVYDPAKKPLPASIELGATIHFMATVYPLEGKRNPYAFNYKNYLASHHIYSQVGISRILNIRFNNNLFSWTWLRQRTIELIDQNFSNSTTSLAKALLIGYKNKLQQKEKMAFSRAGLSHIMAVSGLHVGFIIAPFWLVIPFLWTFRRGKETGLFFFCVLLFFYTGLTGFSASVTRASIMGGLLTYGRLFHKSRDSRNLAAVAAIIILAMNPNQLFDIGFQLSFAAVYIILLILPVIQQFIPQKIQHRWYGIPITVMIVSITIQLGLYPILSYYFGEFSLIGPVANALIIPWLSVVIPYALILLPFSALFPGTGFVMNAPCRWFLRFLHWFVNIIVSWNGSWIQTTSTGIMIFLIWGAAVIFISAMPYPKIRWKALILFLFFLCFQQAKNLYQKIQPSALNITMLDVGQGDATYVQTPAGKHFLIDTGRWTPGYNSARYVIMPHLKALGVQKLDAVFLSHPHADHIGGIAELIKNIPIDTIYNSGQSYDSRLYRQYHQLARTHHIPIKSVHAGMCIKLDSLMRIFIYGPSAKNHYSDPNEHSVVMELVYGETQFLFMGDAGSPEEELVFNNYADLLDTDFLKVGHHGSRTSSSAPFLKIATPTYEAVSLGLHNKFSHPNVQAVQRLSQLNAHLYFTSLKGALQFSSDGSTVKYKSWH